MDEKNQSKEKMNNEVSRWIRSKSHVEYRSRGNERFSSAVAVATGVSKENVSPDQPRSSSLASAFDATAEIFTSFDLAFRWDSLPVLRLVDPDHALHVRVTSLEHYQPLCMPDASALVCRYAYICVYICVYMCARLFAYTYELVCVCRTADLRGTYANTYGQYMGTYRDV